MNLPKPNKIKLIAFLLITTCVSLLMEYTSTSEITLYGYLGREATVILIAVLMGKLGIAKGIKP